MLVWAYHDNQNICKQNDIFYKQRKNEIKMYMCCIVIGIPGSLFTIHFQEHSLSFLQDFVNLNVTQLLIG